MARSAPIEERGAPSQQTVPKSMQNAHTMHNVGFQPCSSTLDTEAADSASDRLGDEEEFRGRRSGFHGLPNLPHRVTALEATKVIGCKNLVSGVGDRT